MLNDKVSKGIIFVLLALVAYLYVDNGSLTEERDAALKDAGKFKAERDAATASYQNCLTLRYLDDDLTWIQENEIDVIESDTEEELLKLKRLVSELETRPRSCVDIDHGGSKETTNTSTNEESVPDETDTNATIVNDAVINGMWSLYCKGIGADANSDMASCKSIQPSQSTAATGAERVPERNASTEDSDTGSSVDGAEPGT